MLIAAMVLAAVGCHSSPIRAPSWLSRGSNRTAAEPMVLPRPGGEPKDLTADDVIRVMRHIGFPDPQILSLGPTLRDALRSSGAAAFVRGRQVDVMLAINSDYIFIQSAQQGSSIYDIKDKQFAAVPPMSPTGD